MIDIHNIKKKRTKINILTYATNYDYETYERFIGSLYDTGFTGITFIIIKETDLPILKLLKIKYKNIICLFDDLEKNSLMHVNNHRFFIKQKYLKTISFECDYLLLCDFRDVLFQKNIENYDFNDIDLFGFLEGIKINQELACNTPWLKKLEEIFNESFYEKISNENVICCGTTIGSINSIKQYVDLMCYYISKYNIYTNLDQGIHNYLFYLNKFNGLNVKLLSNDDNLVNTVCCDVKILDGNNNIVNKNNNISYIVHQYDRFPFDLKKKISHKHGYNFMK